jgi:hypothetical protein
VYIYIYSVFNLKLILIALINFEIQSQIPVGYSPVCSFFSTSQVGEGVCAVLLGTLTPMATEMLANGDGTGFPELMVVMATLASAGQGAGHLQLHNAAVDWLGRW